jgi:hypothetical protein
LKKSFVNVNTGLELSGESASLLMRQVWEQDLLPWDGLNSVGREPATEPLTPTQPLLLLSLCDTSYYVPLKFVIDLCQLFEWRAFSTIFAAFGLSKFWHWYNNVWLSIWMVLIWKSTIDSSSRSSQSHGRCEIFLKKKRTCWKNSL